MKVRKIATAIPFLLIFLLALSFSKLQAHPFYVSICEMNYKNDEGRLEISLRIFTDDLEIAMQNWGLGKLNLGEKNENPKADSLISLYVLKLLRIQVQTKNIPIRYLGKEVERELSWVYLEVDNLSDFDEIKISNRILFQSFAGQSNLIHVNQHHEIKNLLLTKNNPEGILKWESE